MGRWTKYFLDGTSYTGEDNLVSQKKASWTKSQNRNIVAVSLEHEFFFFRINGLGDFWQSDTFESSCFGVTNIVARRIQKQITPKDHYLVITNQDRKTCVASFYTLVPPHIDYWNIVPLQERHVGQWLTIEYDLQKSCLTHFFSKEKI
jgi:hypothetical protein